jgi:uncharacterized membrane protein YfcA
MLTCAGLILIAICIGMLVGAVGVGGFLMPTALMLITGVTVHQGMATSLFTFIFTGIAGTIYFHRQGTINWTWVSPICLGAALTGFAGAWVGSKLSASMLSIVLAMVIIVAGIYTLTVRSERDRKAMKRDPGRQWAMLALIGAATGFLSGLTGIGGPALSVPLMVLCGFSILGAIGVGQVLQIVGAISGSLANLKYGTIDYGLATFISVFEIFGVLLGGYVIHRIDIELIKKFVGGLCLIAGCAFIARTF